MWVCTNGGLCFRSHSTVCLFLSFTADAGTYARQMWGSGWMPASFGSIPTAFGWVSPDAIGSERGLPASYYGCSHGPPERFFGVLKARGWVPKMGYGGSGGHSLCRVLTSEWGRQGWSGRRRV